MTEERIYDNSAISAFQDCRKKYYWSMVRHLQTKTKSNALLFGAAIHDALDIYYVEGCMERAIENFALEFKDREGDDLRTIAHGSTMLREYAKAYAIEPFKVLSKPEEGFVIPIGDVMYGGRLDLPIDWEGELWIMEHKTTSKLSSGFFKQWDLDKQITGYILGMEYVTGRECVGALINAMEPWKPLIRPRATSKRPEDHFVRAPATRTKFLKERFKMNVQRLVRDIRWCMENDEWYEAEKKECCRSYNYDCPFKELCQYGEDERLIEREFVVEEWAPFKKTDEKEDKDANV